MKKNGIKFSVGFLTLLIGIFVSSMMNFYEGKIYSAAKTNNQAFNIKNLNEAEIISKKLSGEIEVRFTEFVQTESGIIAKFIIENNTKDTIFYSDYEDRKAAEGISPLFKIKAEGKNTDLFWCGTGLTSFPIESGKAEIFQIHSNVFIRYWELGKNLQTGFSFFKESEKKYETIWSENLPISKEIERKLSKEKAEFEKPQTK